MVFFLEDGKHVNNLLDWLFSLEYLLQFEKLVRHQIDSLVNFLGYVNPTKGMHVNGINFVHVYRLLKREPEKTYVFILYFSNQLREIYYNYNMLYVCVLGVHIYICMLYFIFVNIFENELGFDFWIFILV